MFIPLAGVYFRVRALHVFYCRAWFNYGIRDGIAVFFSFPFVRPLEVRPQGDAGFDRACQYSAVAGCPHVAGLEDGGQRVLLCRRRFPNSVVRQYACGLDLEVALARVNVGLFRAFVTVQSIIITHGVGASGYLSVQRCFVFSVVFLVGRRRIVAEEATPPARDERQEWQAD